MARAEGEPESQRPHGPEPAASAPRRLHPELLLGALSEAGVEFVIIGGFALAPHGYVRATKDIDIVPEPSPANLVRLASALRSLQAQVGLGDIDSDELGIEPDEEGLGAGGNWVLQTRFGRLDVMQDVPGLRGYQHLRTGAVEVDGAFYAGYDELIAMKAASGREEDLRDIGALEQARRRD